MCMSNFYDDFNLDINYFSKMAFNCRRKKIIKENGICFYDSAKNLVRTLIELILISTQIPGNCDINSIELLPSNDGNFAFSFYMRNGEYHKNVETLEKYERLFAVAKKISDTEYNTLVLFEAMKIWDKLDNFYISNWRKTTFENGAESVKFSMMQ